MKIKNRKILLFWKSCIMMLCMQLVSMIALLASNHMLTERQTEFYLEIMKEQIAHNCEIFANELYKTYALPDTIGGTRYYDYIRAENSGKLPKKYVSVLPLLRRALNNQMFLQGNNAECLLYFSGADCIVTRERVFSEAAECFEEYLRFSELSSEEIFQQMKKRSNVRLLQMQEVTIANKSTQCISLLIRPMNSRIAVLSLYTEKAVQDMLGLGALPEGSAFRLVRSDGELLYSSNGETKWETGKEYYVVSSQLKGLDAEATFQISRAYLQEIGKDARMAGVRLLGISFLLGILLNFLLSEMTTTPMRKLLQSQPRDSEKRGIISEVEYLSDLILDIQIRARNLQLLFENTEGEGRKRSLNWLWHERLYQSILVNDAENTMHLLEMISEEPCEGTSGLEIFYNVLFVLRSAAEELKVDVSSLSRIQYGGEMSFKENILLLTETAEDIHRQLELNHRDECKREAAEVIAFIRNNYRDERLCPQYVAEQFGLSKKSIYDYVNRETGMGFDKYLLQIRMQQAGVLLCTTNLEVKKVGELCGYFSESTFFRVFKKYYSKTPGEYRKDAGGN